MRIANAWLTMVSVVKGHPRTLAERPEEGHHQVPDNTLAIGLHIA